MTGEQVVRLCRAVARHLAAFADDFERITDEEPDPHAAELKRNERRAAIRKGTAP